MYDIDNLGIDGGMPRQQSPPPLLHKGLVLSTPSAGGSKAGKGRGKKALGADEVGLRVEKHRGMEGRRVLDHVDYMYARPATAPELAQELSCMQLQRQHAETTDRDTHASIAPQSRSSPPVFALPPMRFNCPPLPHAR